MNGRRVTPTARLVWSGDPVLQRDEWLAVRRQGIGSSDAAKIVCPSKWGTALDVYASKLPDAPDDNAGEAALWGTLLEDVVAREWARRTGLRVSRIGVVEHVDAPWMKASVDRRVHGCQPGGCPLEVKTRNQWTEGRWRDDIPDDVLAQLQWQLGVTGWDHGHVACLIGGQRLSIFDVPADEDVQALVVTEAQAVWKAVEDGTPPPIDLDAVDRRVADAFDRLIGHLEGSHEVDPVQGLRFLDEYVTARNAESAAKAAKERAGAALAVLAEGHDTALINQVVAWTRKPQNREHTDIALLRELAPEIADQVVSKNPTRPVLRIAPAFDPREKAS